MSCELSLAHAGTKLLALGLAAALCGCGGKKGAAAVAPEDELWIPRESFERGETSLAEVHTQLLHEPIAAGGRIAFDDRRVSHVSSPVTGRVTRVLAQLGQRVKKGAPLATIASPDVGSAVADAVKAHAGFVAAEHERVRQEKLREAQAASARDYELAEDNFRRARAEDERAQQRLSLLRAGTVDTVTQEYTLASPIDGRVIARAVSPGAEVQGQYAGGTATGEVFTIGNLDSVWLLADVPEEDLPALRLGLKLGARVLAWPDRVFEGRVEWVSPTLDPALRTARIRCSLQNAEGLLKPEMYASVLIERPAAQKLAMPREALVRIGDQPFAYVAGPLRPDGRQIFKRRRLRIPERGGVQRRKAPAGSELFLSEAAEADLLPIEGGLVEGDKVLVDNSVPRLHGADEVTLPAGTSGERVSVVEAVEEDLADSISLGGRLTFDDLRVTRVFPPVGGRVTRLLAAPGQHVHKGTPLAVIASPDLGLAFADELKAKADLAAAEHELKRQRELYAVHASAQRDLEVAEDNHGKARAEFERAAQKARLLRAAGAGEAGSVTQEFTLRSPIEGEVIARNANPGVEVQGQYSAGPNVQELFTIGSLDQLWLLGDLYEVDLPFVRPGAEVALTVPAYPGRVFRGKVDWISDSLDPVQRTARVRCVLQNPQGLLRPEMYELIHIAAPSRHALTVPRDALLRVGDDTVVFVEEAKDKDGSRPFRRRRVIANEQLPGDRVPVLTGLKPGDRVATTGSIFLLGLL